MSKVKTVTLTLAVTVPVTTGDSEVERAVNAALDEPPCDWGDWQVGAAVISEEER